MALAMGFEDAKTNQIRKTADEPRDGRSYVTTGGTTITTFFRSAEIAQFPHATLAQREAGRVSPPHFHRRDQFQVVVGGTGKIGRHDLFPYCVHFTRAYTPYGPLVSGAGAGLSIYALRAHLDPGSQDLPEERDQLKQASARQPWQITRPVSFPALQSQQATTDVMLQAVQGIEDQNGLAVYTLSMQPYTKAYAPDPARGDGQYLVIVKGSLVHEEKEHKTPALVFVYPQEGPLQVYAGSQGLAALVLNFPRPQTRASGASVQATAGFKTWQCALCSFVYDEAAGLPEEGIAPGTRWQEVPETWSCPDCSASKADFQMIELPS